MLHRVFKAILRSRDGSWGPDVCVWVSVCYCRSVCVYVCDILNNLATKWLPRINGTVPITQLNNYLISNTVN